MQGVNSLGHKFYPVYPNLPNPTLMVFNDGIEVITKIKRIICFFCEEKATEGRTSRSICHGLTRNFTEKTEAETRNEEKTKEEALPRINTEFHGNKYKKRQKQRHGNKTKNKQKHLPRTNTELHGKDRSRDTEKTEAETRNEEHIIRSQMRERRYKYTV